jgi:hypothetical protein
MNRGACGREDCTHDDCAGDIYHRREVSDVEYQCGCKWERTTEYGDVLRLCQIHRQATDASYWRKRGH